MNIATPRLAGAALASLLALSACNSNTETVNESANNEAAELPPMPPPRMIQASRIYRCKDNSLLYTDFYTDNSVRVHAEKNGPKTTLNADAEGNPPFTAEGYSLSENAATISYTAPGKGAQSCKTS